MHTTDFAEIDHQSCAKVVGSDEDRSAVCAFCIGPVGYRRGAMHGYRVTLQDGRVRMVEANIYEVAEDGALAIIGGREPVERWDAGEWLMIDEFGTRLSDHWPPPLLDDLVNEVATLLAVRYGHYVHGLRDADAFEDWRCNDLDSFTSALLERVGLMRDDSAEHGSVRELVARHFRVDGA